MEPVSCKFCGEKNLYWESYLVDGKLKWRLMDFGSMKHKCPKKDVGQISADARDLAHRLLKFADNFDIYQRSVEKEVVEVQKILNFSVYIKGKPNVEVY